MIRLIFVFSFRVKEKYFMIILFINTFKGMHMNMHEEMEDVSIQIVHF